MPKNPKKLIFLFTGVIIIGLSGYFIYQKNLIPNLKPKPQKSVLEQIQEQQKILGFSQETHLISGKITAIDNNSLTLSAVLPVQNTAASQIPTERKIIISDTTAIKKIISLPKIKGGQVSYTNTAVEIKLQDLKVDDNIEVFANEDIKYKKEITPKEIRLLPSNK